MQNYSCLFSSRPSAARQLFQPMHSQSANFGKFKLNSHNLAGIILHHSVRRGRRSCPLAKQFGDGSRRLRLRDLYVCPSAFWDEGRQRKSRSSNRFSYSYPNKVIFRHWEWDIFSMLSSKSWYRDIVKLLTCSDHCPSIQKLFKNNPLFRGTRLVSRRSS